MSEETLKRQSKKGRNSRTSSRSESTEGRNRTLLPRRLAAVTATGPVFERSVGQTAVPLSSALALCQELAARTLDPEASVVSSMAARLGGNDAYTAWQHMTAGLALRLADAAPELKAHVLDEVLEYLSREGNADGIEPVIAAAVNAAWWTIDPDVLRRILTYIQTLLSRTTFTDTHGFLLVDPNARTATEIAAGQLKCIDTSLWLEQAQVAIEEWRLGVAQQPGQEAAGLLPTAEDALNGLGGGSKMPGYGGAGTNGGMNLPGRGGSARNGMGGLGSSGVDALGGPGVPDMGGAGTQGGMGIPGLSGTGNGLDLPGLGGADNGMGERGLSGPGMGSGANLPGRGGAGTAGGMSIPGLGGGPQGPMGLGGPGPHTGGPFGSNSRNIGKSGGPTGFGSALGQGGASSWVSTAEKAYGAWLVVGGVVAIVGSGGAGMAAGTAAIGVGAILISDANHREDVELHEKERAEDKAEKASGGTAGGTSGGTGGGTSSGTSGGTSSASTGKASSSTGTPVKQLPDAPTPVEKLPDAPKEGDKYPDPHGKGSHLPAGDDGPGDPTMLPTGDGDPGDPTMLPPGDEGTGGNPTTMWEENGGGVTPTTMGLRLTGSTTFGRGMRSAITQIGANTFVF